MNLVTTVESWDKSYGTPAKWLWNLILYPALAIALWSGTAYLDKTYVPKAELREYVVEQRQELKAINGKLDTLLLESAANGQRFSDTERRISRLEDKQ